MFTGSKYMQALDERAERATPGPWVHEFTPGETDPINGWSTVDCHTLVGTEGMPPDGPDDYEFIAAARTDIEVLSARVKELERALQICRTANPQPDLSHEKYRVAFQVIEETVAAALAAKPPGEE